MGSDRTEPTTGTRDVVNLMHRRAEILACLVEEPREKRVLVNELDIARSTLDRAIRELEAIDLVTYVNGEYAITTVGEYLSHNYFTFVEQVQLAMKFEPFLRHVTLDEFDLDLRCLAEAELWTPEPNDPYAMVNHHVEMIRQAKSVRGILPIVGLHALEAACEQVIEHGADHEMIVEPGIAETLQSNEKYRPLYRKLSQQETVTIHIYDGTIPYFVGIFDDEIVQIGVDQDGEPRALVETDRQEVQAWADETFEAYKRQTTPLASVSA